MPTLLQRRAALEKKLRAMGSVLVAFSGGADSSLLLKIAAMNLPQDKILAVTATSATYPAQELFAARALAKKLGVRHTVIRTREAVDKRFIANTMQRCYYCKRELFSRLCRIAKTHTIRWVLDATTVTDRDDFRPGTRAKVEFGVRSPLQEAGFTKRDVRALSKALGLTTWDKPSLACLSSRIPYGTRITSTLLRRINSAEEFLRSAGFKQVRIRDYGPLCRIEVEKKDLSRLLAKSKTIAGELKNYGYRYVTADLDGYRTGSMNEVIAR